MDSLLGMTAGRLGSTPRRGNRFALKLKDLSDEEMWLSLPGESLGGWATTQADQTGHRGPGLLDQHFGATCNHEALFTYLFRRFGFPNLACDERWAIARYVVTTPLPDMVMILAPTASNQPRESIYLAVIGDTQVALERGPGDRWKKDLVAWVEAQGLLPDWMDEWLELWRKKPEASSIASGDRSDWVASMRDMFLVKWEIEDLKGDWRDKWSYSHYLLYRKIAKFMARILRQFDAIQPCPLDDIRAADWRTWPKSDPLRRYYAAAAVALEDLRRPVRIGHAMVNAHGLVSEYDPLADNAVQESAAAGFALGALGNKAPKEMATLHAHVRVLGKGNAKRGVAKLLARAGLSGELS